MHALTLALAFTAFASGSARGQTELAPGGPYSPYAPALRAHYYGQLAKSPWRALGYELLLPGAGSAYTGLYAPAVATLTASLGGAALWVAGALRENRAIERAGIATFAAARAYGAVSAPIGAVLLNAAFRRQLGISVGLRL